MNPKELIAERFSSFFPKIEIQNLAKELYLNLSQGSICLDSFQASLEEPDGEFLTAEKKGIKPFVLFNGKYYMKRYFQYETRILEKIQQMASNQEELENRLDFLKNSEVFMNLVSSRDVAREVDLQLFASVMAFLQNFCIITGGPGTGKTTTLAKVLTLLLSKNKDLKISLAAPTGKAAMRMEETLKSNPSIPIELKETFQNLKASTIHRLLGTINLEPNFKHHSGNPLNSDVVIIDEASMIDVALFAKLLDAIGPDTCLILVGDQNQLASVEAGSLFGDLCSSVEQQNSFSTDFLNLLQAIADSGQGFSVSLKTVERPSLIQNHLVALKYSYRFRNDKLIGLLSKAIIDGNQDEVKSILIQSSESDEVTFDPDYQENIFKDFAAKYIEYIAEKDISTALKKLNSIRVLAAIRMGKQGIYELNRKIESILFSQNLIRPNSEFYENRPVLVTKNYHDLKLFNGDVGIVRDGKVWFPNGDGVRPIAPGFIAEVETVFAMTIHKSQGSEFDEVLMVLPKSEEIGILTRELLYTGITRAKNKLIIQGSNEVLQSAIQKQVKRSSGVKERLQNPSLI